MITIKPEDEFTLKLSGQALQVLVAGLGELPHKLSGPVETELLKQIEAALKEREPKS